MNQAHFPRGPLQDQIALVTGATAFIGRAIALELARRGAHVIVNDRNPEAGQAVINEIAASGYSATFEQADLTNSNAVHAMVDRVAEHHGRLDILVASGAGASADSPSFRLFKEMRDGDVDNYIRAHWLARAFAIQAAARVMALHGRGKIVAAGTDAGRVATVGESFIGGATGGMMQMCRVLARELGRDGIRANAAAFFAGPESDAITGQTLSVNGGLSTPG